ncbi:hypothetical protein FOXYSP1_02620 [Fusarium oxysporum f. sp. phaseoli]
MKRQTIVQGRRLRIHSAASIWTRIPDNCMLRTAGVLTGTANPRRNTSRVRKVDEPVEHLGC